jgi:hypothetical protein
MQDPVIQARSMPESHRIALHQIQAQHIGKLAPFVPIAVHDRRKWKQRIGVHALHEA